MIQHVSRSQFRELLCSLLRNWGCCTDQSGMAVNIFGTAWKIGSFMERLTFFGTFFGIFLERTRNAFGTSHFWKMFWNIFGKYLDCFWNVGTLTESILERSEMYLEFLERFWNKSKTHADSLTYS